MTTEERQQLRDAIMAVGEDASIIFFDPAAVDIDGVELMWMPDDSPRRMDVVFIPVCVPHGKTIRDFVYAVSAEQAQIAPEEIERCH